MTQTKPSCMPTPGACVTKYQATCDPYNTSFLWLKASKATGGGWVISPATAVCVCMSAADFVNCLFWDYMPILPVTDYLYFGGWVMVSAEGR